MAPLPGFNSGSSALTAAARRPTDTSSPTDAGNLSLTPFAAPYGLNASGEGQSDPSGRGPPGEIPAASVRATDSLRKKGPARCELDLSPNAAAEPTL